MLKPGHGATWWLAIPLLLAAGHTQDEAAPPPAIAPILHDSLWKLSASAKGFVVNLDGTVEKAKFKTTAFMLLSAVPVEGGTGTGDGGTEMYDPQMWTFTAGNWTPYAGDPVWLNGAEGDLVTDTFFLFHTDEANVGARTAAKLTIKTDGGLILKSAKLKSLAGLVYDSFLFPPAAEVGGLPFYGSMKLSGKTVDVDSLPFTP